MGLFDVGSINEWSSEQLPECWVSIDPGDVHCGVTMWRYEEIKYTIEWSPDQLLDTLICLVGTESDMIQHIVLESFQLYGWKSASLDGNEFLTSQLIGAIKLLVGEWRSGVSLTMQRASEGKRPLKMKPMIDLVSRGRGSDSWRGFLKLKDGVPLSPHVKDSASHGLWWLKTRGVDLSTYGVSA